MVDNSKLRELQLKQEMLERLLPQFSERNQARVRAQLSIICEQLEQLRNGNDSPTSESQPSPKPRTAA